MKRSFAFLLALFFIASTVSAQGDKKPEKVTIDELVSRHIASIGTPEALAAVKSRVIVGQGSLTSMKGYAGRLTGPAQFASDPDRMLFVMLFNSKEYPYEKAAFDGKNPSVALPNGTRTPLADFLKAKGAILEEGLFTGVLSSAWPLLNVSAKKAKVEYAGPVKLGDKWLHKVKYASRKDPIRISLFFDPETFRHVLTEYYYTIDIKIGVSSTHIQGQKDYFTLTERFSDFKKAGDLTLPFSYSMVLDRQVNTQNSATSFSYTVNLGQVYYNEPLEPSVFKVS